MKFDYKKGQIFQHIDGGFYQFDKCVKFADDNDTLVIYTHIWPFPPSEAARRLDEFKRKFTPVADKDLEKAQAVGMLDFQAIVRDKKEKRKKIS